MWSAAAHRPVPRGKLFLAETVSTSVHSSVHLMEGPIQIALHLQPSVQSLISFPWKLRCEKSEEQLFWCDVIPM